MKFFHLGDLHFGKTMHNVSLVESDQPFWVEQFLKAVDEYEPDAVVIAGDVYDRRTPSPEAMTLFGQFLTELAKRDKYVFVIPGNHDSSARLSHMSRLLTSHKIFIAGELERELTHITVPGDPVDVTFWLMPYLFPSLVSDQRVLDQKSFSSYDEATRALLAVQNLDKSACNVLLAHQNVLANGAAPEHSESETIIGGVGGIEYTAFDDFDYVALGHIHNAQKVGRETVRYAGCPLYYDFSEINRKKELTLVTVNSKDDISVEQIKIPLLHELLQKTGTLEELLRDGMKMEDMDRYYIECMLTDKQLPYRTLEQLREVYGTHLVHTGRCRDENLPAVNHTQVTGSVQRMGLDEQFRIFFQEQQQELLDDTQETLVQKILEQQSHRSGEYILDVKSVPRENSQELLDLLLELTKEAQ